jgi:hypothetical protein
MSSYQPSDYETVAVSQTDKVLGQGSGAKGDFLHSVILTVATAASSTAHIDDGGGTDIPLLAANTPIGVYTVILNLRSKTGAWRMTTGAGVTAIATGDFT